MGIIKCALINAPQTIGNSTADTSRLDGIINGVHASVLKLKQNTTIGDKSRVRVSKLLNSKQAIIQNSVYKLITMQKSTTSNNNNFDDDRRLLADSRNVHTRFKKL